MIINLNINLKLNLIFLITTIIFELKSSRIKYYLTL